MYVAIEKKTDHCSMQMSELLEKFIILKFFDLKSM